MMIDERRKRPRKRIKSGPNISPEVWPKPSNGLVLIALLVATTVTNFFMALFAAISARKQVASAPEAIVDDGEEHPNIYERGGPMPPMRHQYDEWGYERRPSLVTLMRDLSRPGRYGRLAAEALLARIENPATRAWAAVRIADGDFLELRRAKLAGTPADVAILTIWDSYATAEAAADLDEEIDRSAPVAACVPQLGKG